MKFRCLTIGREFGCGSSDLARLLAERLGWKLLDRELIDEIAQAGHVDPAACRRKDERIEGWMHRIGKGLWNSTGEKGPALVPDESLDADRMAALSRKTIEELAAAGDCVIVGRGANYILRERRDAFHLFVYAPLAWRIRRLETQGMARDHAAAEIARQDQHRAAYIRRYFDDAWPQPHLYHLMINASLGLDTGAAAVLHAMGAARSVPGGA